MVKLNNAITDVPGIKVGHAQDLHDLTGCTVILAEKGAVGGVDQRGGAPGTRETDLLKPVNLVEKVHAVMLAGGSAFGLDAASGAMQYLKEKKIGLNTGYGKVPIVPAAILFDLSLGNRDAYPDAKMGAQACENASTRPPEQGTVGAGTGATVGKILSPAQATKGGIGTASMEIGGGIIIGAIMAVNAFGDVVDPLNGAILAGARTVHKGPVKVGKHEIFADSMEVMKGMIGRTALGAASSANTVIGVVATNAKLNKPQATKAAQMAQNGIARAIRPAHTLLDGDTIFVLATGEKKADPSTVGAFAAEVISQAIVNAVMKASSAGGIPAASDLLR